VAFSATRTTLADAAHGVGRSSFELMVETS